MEKLKEIIEKIKLYLEMDEKNVLETYNFISDKLDKENLDFVLETTLILTSIYADIETILASLLYKLLTNKIISQKELEKVFSHDIIKIASGASKLDKIIYSTENEYLIEYYKKIIVGMSEDVRVIMINLASRVALMRNLDKYEKSFQKKKAKESLEIVAPIAHHLGIYKLKSELEDLSLKYLKPDVYYDIVEKLNSTKKERDNLISKMTNEVKTILENYNIEFEIKGRSKSIYSIYNKLDKGRKFNDIYDLFALRIMVLDEATCYLVLGLIHSKFKPIPKRFKDFIAMPKSNGYRSLHTTVFGVDNILFEIQIRTYQMNEVAENGLASHWSYKEHRSASTDKLTTTDQKLEFFKTVIDNYQDNVNSPVFEEMQDNKMHGNIYVFTPKGDVIEMPQGSTPIDFAYKVHTEVGEKMIGCTVNNKIVPLNYVLEDNDVVKIITNKNGTPKLSWLKIVKLNQTKNKIKSYFNKEQKEEIIKYGENTLQKYLKKKHLLKEDLFKEINLKKILKELKCKDLNEIYLNIGNSKYSPKTITEIIYPSSKDINNNKKIIDKNNNDIEVFGINNIKVSIASCCMPIPGDNIIGIVTKSKGITIHNLKCQNLKNKENCVDVKFRENTKNKYLTKIRIYTIDNLSHLGEIIEKLSNSNIIVNNVVTSVVDLKYNYLISFHVKNKMELEYLLNNLKKLSYILNVERVMK